MAETPKSTFRFKDSTRFAIEELVRDGYGRDQTDAVSRAIREAHRGLTGTASQVSSTTTAHSPEPVEDSRPKNCKCAHCGKLFPGSRGSKLCHPCEEKGHGGEPAECSECTAGLAI